MNNCIFCKISQHEVLSDIVTEDENIIMFNDINPKAQTHILAVPKKHISSLLEVNRDDWPLVLETVKAAVNIAKEKKLAGYKLVFNVGRQGGQVIDHLHLHLLSGGKVELP